MYQAGDVNPGQSVPIPYPSHAADGSKLAPSVPGDVRIYKAGVPVARASATGIGLVSNPPFAGEAGLNMLVIDTADNSDPGFFSVFSDFHVAIVGASVDGKPVTTFVGAFSIRNRAGTALFRGFVQAATQTTTTLPLTCPEGAGLLDFTRIAIVGGPGAGQSRLVPKGGYASGRVAAHDPWTVVPVAGQSAVEIQLVALDAIGQGDLEAIVAQKIAGRDKTGMSLAPESPTPLDLSERLDGQADGLTALLTSLGTPTAGTVAGNVETLVAREIQVKRATAIPDFMFKMVLAADGVSAVTGLTGIAARRARDAEPGADFDNAATIAEVAGMPGWYRLSVTANDVDAERIAVDISAPSCRPIAFLILTQD